MIKPMASCPCGKAHDSTDVPIIAAYQSTGEHFQYPPDPREPVAQFTALSPTEAVPVSMFACSKCSSLYVTREAPPKA